MADHGTVRAWLARLVRLTAASLSRDEAAEWLEDIEPLLAYRFDAAAFTFDSLEQVAAGSKFLPTYAEIVERLKAHRDYLAENPPASIALRIGHSDTLSPTDRTQADAWIKRRDASKIKHVASSLDMLRTYRPEVFEYLVATDDQCRSVANRRGWLNRNRDHADGPVPIADVVPIRPPPDAAD